MDGEDPTVFATAISTIRSVVLTGRGDGGVNLWDISSGCLQYKFDSHDVDSLSITNDGRIAFSNYRSINRDIVAWDLNTGSKVAAFTNLVPRALFLSRPTQSQGKAPWGRGCAFTSNWKPQRMAVSGNHLVVVKADRPELMSLRPHLPGQTEIALQEDSSFKDAGAVSRVCKW